jgi:hypothetical protein
MSHAPEQIAKAAAVAIGGVGCGWSRTVDATESKLGEFSFEVTDFQAYNLKNFVSTLFSRNH